jgi:TRAP-type C4-dicarboxylate transport system permease small subunit
MYRCLQKFIYYTTAVLFGFSATLAFLCVIFRYVFNNSIVWGEEAIRLMFIWMFMLCGAECFRKEKHITLDIFLELWPQNARWICKIIIDIILLAFLAMVAYLGIEACLTNMGQKTTALEISFGIVYLAIPVGAILMMFFIIHNLVGRLKNKEPATGGQGK